MRYAATKLVVTDTVLGMRFAVSKASRMNQNAVVTTAARKARKRYSLPPIRLTFTSVFPFEEGFFSQAITANRAMGALMPR